jgi:hypothetical protein
VKQRKEPSLSKQIVASKCKSSLFQFAEKKGT